MRLAPDVVVTDTEDGAVLLDQRSGRYWQLNPAGALALRLSLQGAAPAEVAARLGDGSPAPAGDRALADVQQLLSSLRSARLVENS